MLTYRLWSIHLELSSSAEVQSTSQRAKKNTILTFLSFLFPSAYHISCFFFFFNHVTYPIFLHHVICFFVFFVFFFKNCHLSCFPSLCHMFFYKLPLILEFSEQFPWCAVHKIWTSTRSSTKEQALVPNYRKLKTRSITVLWTWAI